MDSGNADSTGAARTDSLGSSDAWIWRAGAGLLLLVGAGIALRFGLQGKLDPQGAVSLLRSVEHTWWAVPAYLLSYLVLTTLFLPTVVFHLASGAAWGFSTGIALNLFACNAVANLQFAAARWLGKERVHALLARRGLTGWEAKAEEEGLRAVLVVRQLPLPTMAVNLGAGVSAIRWRDFALGTVLGTLPATVIYTWFASALVEGVASARRQVMAELAVAVVLLVALALGPKAFQWRKARRAARAGQGEGPG